MTVNSGYGFPYPLSSEPVANGASNIQSLATAVDSKMGLYKIIPTGATNGSVTSDGDVIINNGTASVAVANAFSSLYDSYQIIVTGGGTNGGDYGVNMRLGATVSNYYYVGEYRNFPNTVNNVINGAGAAEWGAVGIATANNLAANVFVNMPFLTKNSYFAASYIYSNPAGGLAQMGGYLADNNSYTGFTLFINASSFAGGTIRVYGYRN